MTKIILQAKDKSIPVSFAAISSEPGMNKTTRLIQLDRDQPKTIEQKQGRIYIKYPITDKFYQKVQVNMESENSPNLNFVDKHMTKSFTLKSQDIEMILDDRNIDTSPVTLLANKGTRVV